MNKLPVSGTKGKEKNLRPELVRPLRLRLIDDFKKNWILYLMILPVLMYFIVFAYAPMSGVILAFKDFKVKLGIFGSPWVGLKYFERFFGSFNFSLLLKNTIGISLYTLLIGFPIPIIFALLLNYLRLKHLKKTLQMVSYAPYFISTVVICGMIAIFMDKNTGIFNQIIVALGGEAQDFLSKPQYFKSIYVWSGVWQGMGYSSIIYISALSGVDPALHEAAIMDGATKWQQFKKITFPLLMASINNVVVLSIIGGLKVFDIVVATTGGGPGYATEVFNTMIYNSYSYQKYGEATAGTTLLAGMILIITLCTYRTIAKNEVEL